MSQPDLAAELIAAVGRVSQVHLDWLMGAGVSSGALASLGATQPPFGIGHVEFLEGSLWQPLSGPGSIGAVVQPVYEDGVLTDLIAWRSLKPDDWRWRTGDAWALGPDALAGDPWDGLSSITVHATPLAWLADGGKPILRIACSSTVGLMVTPSSRQPMGKTGSN